MPGFTAANILTSVRLMCGPHLPAEKHLTPAQTQSGPDQPKTKDSILNVYISRTKPNFMSL